MDELISSKHVMEFPLDAFGTKLSPAVMPFGQMMHGSSTSGAKVEVVVVVATVESFAGAELGAGVFASSVGVSVGVSVGIFIGASTLSPSAGVGVGVIASTVGASACVSVGAATLTSSAGAVAVIVGQHEIMYTLLSAMHV